MIVELLIFTFLSNSVVQALPLSNLNPSSTEVPCNKKISWYREITEQTKRLYNEYYANLAEASLNPENLQTLNEEHKNFENTVSEVSKGPRDDTEKEIDCQADIDWYERMNANLTKAAMDIKKELLDVLNRSEVPSSQQKDITDLLSGLVNFLFTVDLPTNQFKDLNTSEKEGQIDQEDKLLESAHKAEKGHYEINSNFDDHEIDKIFQSLYVNHPAHHTVHHPIHPSVHHSIHHPVHHDHPVHHPIHHDNPVHRTSHDTRHTDKYEDIHYTTKRPSRHHTIHPTQNKYIPGAAVAVGCVVLIVIVIAMVAVLCPCKRTPYSKF